MEVVRLVELSLATIATHYKIKKCPKKLLNLYSDYKKTVKGTNSWFSPKPSVRTAALKHCDYIRSVSAAANHSSVSGVGQCVFVDLCPAQVSLKNHPKLSHREPPVTDIKPEPSHKPPNPN